MRANDDDFKKVEKLKISRLSFVENENKKNKKKKWITCFFNGKIT